MAREVKSSLWLATGFTLVTLLLLNVAGAQVMTSANYQLQSDSINVGGGYSTSTNYIQESTVGEIATGPSDSTSFSLRAGYQQMQEVFISLSVTGDVIMDTPLGGITGGTSNGSTTATVITDAPAGYQLTIEAENSPAMQQAGGTDTIADYSGAPDYTFTTAAADAHFGFTPTGVDITNEFSDAGGATCGAGTVESIACWDGLSTTARLISEGTSANHTAGATTTIHFRVGIGGNQPALAEGFYFATTTLTAIPQ